MEHIPFNPTDEQRANLERLAAHLDLEVTNYGFDMEDYARFNGAVLNPCDQFECGTVCCAVGHGPSLGIAANPHEDWDFYRYRAFGAVMVVFGWLFSSAWRNIDNTPRGAAARIRYALKHGIPENWPEQLTGEHPLCYEVKPLTDPVIKVRDKVGDA